MLQAAAAIPEADIRSAVSRAFGAVKPVHITIWQRIKAWIAALWMMFWQWISDNASALHVPKPVLAAIVAAGALTLAVLLVATVWAWRAHERAARPGMVPGGRLYTGGDPWAAAQAFAAAGDYTAAAHALYAALLEFAARAQQVRLHPSKTAGDYARELRSRRSKLAPGFRSFAGDYEVVIYGEMTCDADRYGRLYALAAPMLSSDG
jgi:hypothetical protein